MDKGEVKRAIEDAFANTPRIDGVSWPMMLAAHTLFELEARMPGFKNAVRERISHASDGMATSDDADARADAPSMRELADCWIFTAQPSDSDPAG